MRRVGVYQYEVAEAMGHSESWLAKRLRKELAGDEAQEIMEAIEIVRKAREQEGLQCG